MSEFLEKVKEIIDGIGDTIEEFKQVSGLWEKIEAGYDVIVEVIKGVEAVGAAMAGQDKKELAKATLLELYAKYINIKWIPDALENTVVSAIINVVIDTVVDELNKRGIFTHKEK